MADFRPLLQCEKITVAKMQHLSDSCHFSVMNDKSLAMLAAALCIRCLIRVKVARGNRRIILQKAKKQADVFRLPPLRQSCAGRRGRT